MILVAGSANLDFVVRASRIPAAGETVLGRDFQTFPGGKGANQAVACSRAGGATTHLLAALGMDAFSSPIERSLHESGVELLAVRVADHPTGTAFICISDDAENAITVAPGANVALKPEHLPPLTGYSHLLLQLETPLATVVAYAQAASAHGVVTMLNAAPAQALPAELTTLVDILIVNEGELSLVAGLNASVAKCLDYITVPIVVVTLGHRGCCARVNGQLLWQPAFKVFPVDTTAAGDTFCGAVAAALCAGQTMAQAMRLASAAAALACTRLGAQTSVPTVQEVQNLLDAQPTHDASAVNDLKSYCDFS